MFRALHDPDDEVFFHVAQAVGKQGAASAPAIDLLVAALSDSGRREIAINTLGHQSPTG
ncbi:hypothetical protein [Lignipirellula cremea]|uniref:hypothetical protein n=1 Tax=Lignipirellula cremea TaxID=2528010 RepID=UPI0037037CC4